MSAAAALGVSSLWFNMDVLLHRALPGRWGQILLGVCGGAGTYRESALAEFETSSLLPQRLRMRSGIHFQERTDGPGQLALRAWLRAAKCAIVAVDSFHLPYRPAFRRVHSGRTLIVRPLPAADVVSIEDWWPPVWKGVLPFAALEPARASLVKMDARREPVFAGSPSAFRWWSLEAPAAPPSDPCGWLAARLADVAADDESHETGGSASAEFLRALARCPAETPDDTRRSSLILRAELSAKIYNLCLIEAAASLLGDALLAQALQPWRSGLTRLAHGRDLLIKQTASPSSLYLRLIGEDLLAAAAAQEDLAALVGAYGKPKAVAARYA